LRDGVANLIKTKSCLQSDSACASENNIICMGIN